jgi:hypothetical protein
MNFASVLAAAQRAQAAYIDDAGKARAAFEALGLFFIGQYQNDSHQAVLSQDAAANVYLTISGTRFSQGKICDLLDDIDLEPVSVGDGAMVTRGAYEGLDAMWSWAQNLAPADAIFNVEGHSLGAWRARYTPLFLARSRIGLLHSFESPKGANAAYWSKYEGELATLVSVVNGRDLWVSWPFIGEWCHPCRDQIWLQSEGFQINTPTQWPGGRAISDHDIDLVVTRLQQIVLSPPRLPASVPPLSEPPLGGFSFGVAT